MRDPRTVCVFLGPYRNLTTLTATALWLHPNCQVLNHGIRPLQAVGALSFLDPEDSSGFQRFVDYGVKLSVNIVGSDECSMHSVYTTAAPAVVERFKELHRTETTGPMFKNPMRCFAWKESQQVTNMILGSDVNWDQVFDANSKLRFLMPIRNPMEVAVSNHRQRKWIFFDGVDDNSPRLMLRAVLAEFAWFTGLKLRHPDRFFSFFDWEVSTESLVELCHFLDMQAFPKWIGAVTQLWVLKHPYVFSEGFVGYYDRMARLYFSAWPGFLEKMLQYGGKVRTDQLRQRDWERYRDGLCDLQ